MLKQLEDKDRLPTKAYRKIYRQQEVNQKIFKWLRENNRRISNAPSKTTYQEQG